MIQLWPKQFDLPERRAKLPKCWRGCRKTLPKQTLAEVLHVFLTSISNRSKPPFLGNTWPLRGAGTVYFLIGVRVEEGPGEAVGSAILVPG